MNIYSTIHNLHCFCCVIARTLFGAQWDDVSCKPMPNLLVPLFVRTISVGSEDVLKIWIARVDGIKGDISEMKEPHKQHKQHKPTLPTNLLIPWVRCTLHMLSWMA